jgi:hypothetical protein
MSKYWAMVICLLIIAASVVSIYGLHVRLEIRLAAFKGGYEERILPGSLSPKWVKAGCDSTKEGGR